MLTYPFKPRFSKVASPALVVLVDGVPKFKPARFWLTVNRCTESIISNRLCLTSLGEILAVELSANSLTILLTSCNLPKIIFQLS